MLRNRLIFMVLWILSVVGISFYGGPVSYGLFLMLTAIPLVSLIYLIYVYFTYRIYQEAATNSPVANTGIPYYITLQNEYKVLFSGIKLKFYSAFSEIDGVSDETEYELAPGEGIRLETRLICRYRGEYRVGVSRICIRDPFGLISLSFNNREPLRMTVKPELVTDLTSEDIPDSMDGTEGRHRPDYPDVTVREYVPGDSIKRINWKASARMDRLLVRNDIGDERRGVVIVPDTRRYTEDEYAYIPAENEILKKLLAVSYYYASRNVPVTLAAQSKSGGILIETVDSERGFERYYDVVAGLGFDKSFDREYVLDELSRSGGSVYGNAVILIPDADETDDHQINNR